MAAVGAAALQFYDVGEVLNVGVAEHKEGIEISAVESVDELVDQFDVLLRHRLLLEPGGFEGVELVRVHLDAGDNAVLNGVLVCGPPLNRNAALPPRR